MLDTYYYAKTIKGIVVALSDLYNNMKIERYSKEGQLVKEFRVPFTFGAVNKYQYINKEKEANKKYYMQFPRIALVFNGFNYAPDRARGTYENRYFYDQDIGLDSIDEFISDVQPTPYNFDFSLDIISNSLDEYCQIMENIAPYFNPTLHLRVKEFSFLNVERDLKVIMNGIDYDGSPEQEENEKRIIRSSLSLTVQGWMYRPVTNSKIIKEIQTRYYTKEYDDEGNSYSVLANDCYTSGFASTSAAEEVEPYMWYTSGTTDDKIYLRRCSSIDFDPSDLWVDDEGNYMVDGYKVFIYDDE